jgi:hypothetical protein
MRPSFTVYTGTFYFIFYAFINVGRLNRLRTESQRHSNWYLLLILIQILQESVTKTVIEVKIT